MPGRGRVAWEGEVVMGRLTPRPTCLDKKWESAGCELLVLFSGTLRAFKYSQDKGVVPSPPSGLQLKKEGLSLWQCQGTLFPPTHTHLHPTYSLPGIRDGLGVTLQLFHVSQELFEEVLTG